MVRVRRFLMGSLLGISLIGIAACGGYSSSQTNPGSNTPVSLTSLTISPGSVNGGQTVNATLTLTGPAPAGGVRVMLISSSDSVILPMIQTINGPLQEFIVPAGATTGTFKIRTIAVGSNQTVQITATYLVTVIVQASFTLTSTHPLSLSSFTVNTTSFASGQTLVGTVTLSAPAFSPGQQVFIASSDASVQPQNPVTVPTNATSVGFSIFTSPLSSQRAVTVTATLNTSSVPVQLTLQPTATAITSLVVVPFTAAGGTSMTGVVTISPPAPSGGAVISLTAAFTNIATAPTTPLPVTVPATVTVAAGATQAQFNVGTSKVTKTTDVTLTASLNSSGTTYVVEIVPSLTLAGFSCTPAAVTTGNSVTCDITLNIPAPAGGQTVMLTSSTPTAIAVPASVVVPAGSPVFSLNLVGGAVTSPTSSTLTATLQGSTTGSVTTSITAVPVSALGVSSFTLSATIAQGGAGAAGNITGTVSISGAAPPGGLTVTLMSSDPSVQFPNGTSLLVPQYGTSVTFPITTTAVASSVNVTLTASVNATSQVATLSVVPPPQVLSLSISPTSVMGGDSALATVTLTGAAPQFGTSVTLQSNSTDAQVGPSVTVPAGATSTVFAVTTLAVAAPEVATITASIGASSQPAMLTITPPPPNIRLIFFNPATIVTGQTSTGTVTLTAPAPAGGLGVGLSSAAATVVVPASVTVPAGSTSASFQVRAASGITTSTPVIISAAFTAQSVTQITNTVTVIPAQAATITEQVVVTGETNATDFPLHGAAQGSLAMGNDSGFVTSIGLSTPVSGASTASYTFSTYAGGASSFGQVRDVFVDSSGNVFACGVTMDGTLHPTANAAQATFGGGQDAFIVEYNSSGALQYLSYLGGSGDETCNAITTDGMGIVFVIGSTTNSTAMNANNLTGTTGAFQTTNSGGSDWFVARINPAGTSATTRLEFLTLIGGANDDFANGRVALTSAGALVITGTTQSTAASPAPVGFPIPPSQGRPVLSGAGTAGVVLIITPDGRSLLSTTLIYGRSLGGNPPDPANPTTTTATGGLAIDTNNNVYVCGQTNASDLPVSKNAFQPALLGQQNGYVAVINQFGALVSATYLGGTSSSTLQACKAIAVDSEMNPVIVMPTDAADYPLLGPGPAGLSGPSDIAVTKLTSDLSTLVFSRLVGGSGSESADATRIQKDAAENLYFSLATNSVDFPVTANALQGTFAGASGGANTNVAVVKLSSDGAALLYSSYLGGSTGTNSTTSVFYRHN